jgi:competence protein ComEC
MSPAPERRPCGPLAVAVVLAVGIGIARALALPSSAGWVLAAFAITLAARWRSRSLVLACVAALGVARGGEVAMRVPTDAIADDRGVDRIEGVVEGWVVATNHGFGARLATDRDSIWIWTTERVQPGERIAVHGRLKTPRGFLAPGQPDRADAAAARGTSFELVVQRIEHLADEPGYVDTVWRWAARTQTAWSARIEQAGGDREARAALRGIVVGDRAEIPESLDARWRAVGVFHVLSVSGLHLAVVAGLAFALLRRLVAAAVGSRLRPARWAAPPALVIAIGYTLITGAQLATLRALIVIVLVLLAAMLDRPLKLLDAIGIAALAILVWRPADLFDPSFQLSFVAAIVLASMPKIERGWLLRGAITTVWVTLATAPLTAYHFHQLTPGGVVGNLILTPLLELAALPLALVGIVTSWDLPIRIATELVGAVDHVAGWLEHAMPVGRIAIESGGVVVALVALTLWLASRTKRSRADVIGWAVLCAAWTFAYIRTPSGELRVTFLDIGQGDAAIVELPDGAVWLVDANAPGKTISRALAVYGKRGVDLAIISHPHPDHYAGLATLDVPVHEVWSANGEPHAGLDAAVRDIPVRTHPPLGVARSQAGVELVVWAPHYDFADGAAEDPVRSVNDNSLVVELRYRGRSILFTGDLEAEGEEALVEAGVPAVDVVKVAHHGSPTSSTLALVEATRPTLAVISCGRANQFGFPSPAVIERWQAAGADVARTDTDGSVTVRIDASGGLAVSRRLR